MLSGTTERARMDGGAGPNFFMVWLLPQCVVHNTTSRMGFIIINRRSGITSHTSHDHGAIGASRGPRFTITNLQGHAPLPGTTAPSSWPLQGYAPLPRTSAPSPLPAPWPLQGHAPLPGTTAPSPWPLQGHAPLPRTSAHSPCPWPAPWPLQGHAPLPGTTAPSPWPAPWHLQGHAPLPAHSPWHVAWPLQGHAPLPAHSPWHVAWPLQGHAPLPPTCCLAADPDDVPGAWAGVWGGSRRIMSHMAR